MAEHTITKHKTRERSRRDALRQTAERRKVKRRSDERHDTGRRGRNNSLSALRLLFGLVLTAAVVTGVVLAVRGTGSAEEEPLRIRDSEITVFVNELSGSSVDLGLRFFVMAPDYWQARWDTIERAKSALEEAGFTIPFSQMDVHIDAPAAEKMNVNG